MLIRHQWQCDDKENPHQLAVVENPGLGVGIMAKILEDCRAKFREGKCPECGRPVKYTMEPVPPPVLDPDATQPELPR